MNLLDKSLVSLEWPSLLQQYSEHCLSIPAKEYALQLPLPENQEQSQRKIQETSEAMVFLSEENFGFFEQIEPLKETLLRIKKSFVLDGKELVRVAKLFSVVELLHAHVKNRKGNAMPCPLLSSTIEACAIHTKVKNLLLQALEADGSVKDSASLKLKTLRDQERRLHSEARERLEQVLQRAFRDGYVQERFFDVRDGRYLIPVKTEFRAKIPGTVVESSATKASLFIEPASVRESNDKIKETQSEIQEEIFRILEQLSQSLFPHAEEIAHNYDCAMAIDLIFGRARLSNFFQETKGAAKPEFSQKISLDGLYHPLLPFVISPEKIVRNNLAISQNTKVMIISGPNTGGKTVLLKSLGLAALMARAGFYICCEGKAEIPFFLQILAHIGDAQNLELSLSSFSGSIEAICEILKTADEKTIVLIDEILHATDPEEASALSKAILSELQNRGATAIVTTHLNGLKVSHQSGDVAFLNASMEFDTEKLQPTYRLRLGVPGSSRALEIGSKLGLPSAIVQEAKRHLSQGHETLQHRLDTLEQKERELFEDKEKLKAAEHAFALESERNKKIGSELENQKRTFKVNTLDALRQAERTAVQELEKFIEDYKNKLKEIDERHSAKLEAKERIEKIRERYKEAAEKLEEKLPGVSVEPKNKTESEDIRPSSSFQKNGLVFLQNLKSNGTLLSDPNDTNARAKPAEVLVGTMKMRIDWNKLSPLTKKGAPKQTSHAQYESVACPPELNLIGQQSEPARQALGLYLDKAYRSGRPSVRIIHGVGTGALKKMVLDFLSHSPYEIKVRSAQGNEGGDGCTVVEFAI